MGQSGDWGAAVRAGLLDAVRDVISTYEAVTTTGDWLSLSPPIVRLRALVWRLDGVITEADDA